MNEMKCKSIKHRSDFVIKCLIIKIVNLDCLEVLFRVKISLSDQKCLSQNQFLTFNMENYLDFSIIVVHNIIVDITFIFFIDFEEISNLFSCKFFTLIRSWFVVHHFVKLTQSFRVVFICIKKGKYIFQEELRSL